MRIKLDYGRTGLDVDLPDERLVGPLRDPHRGAARRSRQPAIRAVLDQPDRHAAAGRAGARARKSACILICDVTRPVPNKLILPPLLHT